MNQFSALVTATLIASTPIAYGSVMGSGLIDRDFQDTTAGLSLIYRGVTQPLPGDNTIADQFSVYSRGGGPFSGDYWVTPFLLEITADNQYTIVAIGTSRNLTGQVGVLSFDFETIAGSAALQPGSNYTFGYRNAAQLADDGEVTTIAGTENVGAIPLTGFTDFSDPWSYAFAPNIEIGTVFGTGGLALDQQGLNGRIYSAELSTTIPTPTTLALLGARRRA